MRSPAVLLLVALAACADVPANTTAGTAEPAETSTGDTPSTTGEPTTTTSTTSATTTSATSGAGTIEPTSTTGDATTGATSLESTTGEGSTGDATTGPPPPPPDACAEAEPTCDGTVPAKAGGGLVAVDRCGFPLHDQDTWATQAARVDALRQVLPTIALAELSGSEFNRVAVPLQQVPGGVAGVAQAFRWNDEDNDSTTWIPQGLTGTPDAVAEGTIGGRALVLVSWYHETKGVRVSLVDVTDPAAPRYRHILLVEPVAGEPVSFVPIPVHAGGLAWYGDMLYLVDTFKGFRVFDLRALMRVDTTVDSIGYDPDAGVYYGGLYKFVLPQIGAYTHASACAPRFSSVALDRTSDPPSLVSSEYCSGTSCDGPLYGRVYRWPLDPLTGRLAAPVVWPLAAHYMAQSHVQGAIAIDGTYYLSSSAPAGVAGAMYVLPGGGPSETATWVDSPEDLMRQGDRLWSLSEGAGARTVFAAELSALPP